ncbi:hypothetical protein [Paracoccus haeundaensis]|uniref:Uncharacterized protein n=1 Tax=Paracoccus haeundaensis TaxID=225362 RepID=A0A5C4R319_9RHOB|nr:hypothetical protein [Paracoccus haeundaensis]TNH38336.1 hypothetical protein FHD67_15605 [Paracoccus haeundaensis]
MSQSQLLTKALKAAELVLAADTTDTAELANIAEDVSGISARRILLGIDLTDIDLTQRDISHLLDKQAKYHNAIISSEQRKRFQRSERNGSRRRLRIKIKNLRAAIITEFVEDYEEAILNEPVITGLPHAHQLRAILLEPIRNKYNADAFLNIDYTINVLEGFLPWAKYGLTDFYGEIFRLLSRIQAPVNSDVVNILNEEYFPVFGESLGDLIATMHPTPELDIYWILNLLKHQTRSSVSELFLPAYTVLQAEPTYRARQISSIRPIHIAAIEETLDELGNYSKIIKFLESVNYKCNPNEAERIAVRLTRGDWPASKTPLILNTKTHPRVRGALFRQLLQQGQEDRVIEVLRWLNNARGAVGALSLDDAFRNIESFDVGLRFAQEAAPNFADNQITVVYFALRNLARSKQHRMMLEAFCKSVKYTPPRNIMPQPIQSDSNATEIDRLAELFKSHPSS